MILVKSEKAAERVFDSVVDFIEKKLKLRINRTKSQITRYNRLTFLGFGFLPGKEARLKVPKEIQKRFRKKAKLLFRMGRGMNLRRFINDTLNGDRARKSAYNGRGPWWNSGASHMNQALPNSFFTGLGLVSLRQLML